MNCLQISTGFNLLTDFHHHLDVATVYLYPSHSHYSQSWSVASFQLLQVEKRKGDYSGRSATNLQPLLPEPLRRWLPHPLLFFWLLTAASSNAHTATTTIVLRPQSASSGCSNCCGCSLCLLQRAAWVLLASPYACCKVNVTQVQVHSHSILYEILNKSHCLS